MGALATRCPDCGTSFRVQRAQLTASEGLVRCGRCDAVFDARVSLFDLETGATVAFGESAASVAPQAVPVPPARQAVAPTPRPASAPAPSRPPSVADQTLPAAERDEADFPSTLAESPAMRDGDGRSDPTWDVPPRMDERGASAPAEPVWEAMEPAVDPDVLNQRMRTLLGHGSPASPDASGFERTFSAWAPTSAAPARRGWRFVMFLSATWLTLALPLQWAWTEREALRAQWPGLDAWASRLCPRCEASPWARLDGWTVGASSLQPTPQGGAFQLKLTVHNRSQARLAVPWVDLRLLDGQGQVMLRKALSPQDLGSELDRLEGGGQLTLQSTFRLKDAVGARAGTSMPSGYEVGLFHP